MGNLIGINTDVAPVNQVPGSYRFALNAVNNSKEGDMKSISNERGNERENNVIFDEGFFPIGNCFLRPNEHIYIATNGTYTQILKRINHRFETLFYIKDFGYSQRYQVKIKFKVVNGCEDILIITDGVNPVRYINITSREQYLLTGETVDTANTDGEGWNLGAFNLFPEYTVPSVDEVEVLDSGGSLEIGSYIIALQYLTESLDTSSWLQHVGVIPIYDEAFSGEYRSIDGGNTTTVTTGTTKSIRLEISNLDSSFRYLRIALISNIDGVVSANIIATVPYISDSLTYTITGNEIRTSITLEELVSENGAYDAAEDIELYDNRLWLLNVKEKQVDHSILQQAAFDIKAHWFTETVRMETTGAHDTKSVAYYLDNRSYMRDEVYAFGIQFRFKGGWLSRVYPLAGRQKDTGFYTTLSPNTEPNSWHNRPAPTTGWDSTVYTVGTDIDEADVAHMGLSTGDTVERWEVFNTATYDASLITGDMFEAGEFAYVESTFTYPNNSVYGSNAGLPIRDFKFPDTILSQIATSMYAGGEALNNPTTDRQPSYDAGSIRVLGVKFTNVVIPAEYEDEIEGYEIVRIERTDYNSTVLDKGILSRVALSSGGSDGDYLQQALPNNWMDPITASAATDYYDRNIVDGYQIFHNPLSKFTGNTKGSYLKIDGEQYGLRADYPSVPHSRLMLVPRPFGPTYSFTETVYNRKINNKVIVAADVPPVSTLTVDIDNTEQQEAFYLELNDDLAYSKSFSMWGGYSGAVGGSIYTYFLYAGLKEYLPAQYGQTEGRVYIPTDSILHTTTECEIFGGDTFISPLTFRRCARWDDNYAVLNHNEEDPDDPLDTIEIKQLFKFYVESKINCNLRHEGLETNEIYYPKSGYDDIVAFINLEGATDTDLIPNHYAYNTAFSQENNIKAYFGIPFGFDYDNDCLGEFPQRIACSEKDNVESTSDSNRLFLPNNYRDLPKNKGIGLSLFTRGDRLYAHLERGLYVIPVKDQAVKMGDINAYFGTGEVLSISPSELVSSDKGYAGLSSKWSQVETPYGTVFVSHEDMKVYLLTDTLEPISNNGIYNWSLDNMKFKLVEDFQSLMSDYEETAKFERFRNNASPEGIGFHSTYDPKHDRVIITKRDYRPKFTSGYDSGEFRGIYEESPAVAYADGAIVWNVDEQCFQVVSGAIRSKINYYDTDYFDDCSFTISFSFLSKSWISFHSYIPLFYSYDKEMFFSFYYAHTKTIIPILGNSRITYAQTTNSKYLYKHSNTADFQTYYLVYKPHILDIILRGQGSSNFTNIFLDAKMSRLDTTYFEYYDIELPPFNELIAYNTDQSSGRHFITKLNNYNEVESWSSSTSFARRLGKIWRINNIRNLVTNTTKPIFNSNITDIQSEYYIDKILNTDVIDYNLSQYKMTKMNDLWLGLRLTAYFNQDGRKEVDYTDVKITTNLIDTLNYQSR